MSVPPVRLAPSDYQAADALLGCCLVGASEVLVCECEMVEQEAPGEQHTLIQELWCHQDIVQCLASLVMRADVSHISMLVLETSSAWCWSFLLQSMLCSC